MLPDETGDYLASGLAEEVLRAADASDMSLVTAESCTGGYIAALLAGVEGLSHRFLGGVVVYAEEAKQALLGISSESLAKHGAVSREIVGQMAVRIGLLTRARLALAVSGNTGPRGEDANGQVHIAVATPSGLHHQYHEFGDVGRDEGRRLAAIAALEMLRQSLAGPGHTSHAVRAGKSMQAGR